jgi:hypothetical protein
MILKASDIIGHFIFNARTFHCFDLKSSENNCRDDFIQNDTRNGAWPHSPGSHHLAVRKLFWKAVMEPLVRTLDPWWFFGRQPGSPLRGVAFLLMACLLMSRLCQVKGGTVCGCMCAWTRLWLVAVCVCGCLCLWLPVFVSFGFCGCQCAWTSKGQGIPTFRQRWRVANWKAGVRQPTVRL